MEERKKNIGYRGLGWQETKDNRVCRFLKSQFDICPISYIWFYFRLLWFILFCFALWYGYLLYTPFLYAWNYEPTVIATDQADFPVEKLPFPAITICSNNKIVYRQLESVLRNQPWKGLMSFNWNITQETYNGKFNNNLYSFL